MRKIKISRNSVFPILLFIFCLLIHVFSYNRNWVERFYSNGFYYYSSFVIRTAFGILPFSFGDIIYFIIMCFMLVKVILYVKRKIIARHQKIKNPKKISWRKALIYFFSIYIIFNLFWGLNYDRIGLAKQMGLDIKKYDTNELIRLNLYLVQKINISKAHLLANESAYPGIDELNKRVVAAYEEAALKYPFLKYSHLSVKSSIWSGPLSYTGITGYYNPFTAEAQVNTNFPRFVLPYVSCHEVAHQLGYAKEMEANFAGYLVAVTARDTLLKYSAYLDMFLYANNNLGKIDSVSANRYRNLLSPDVSKDLRELREFNKSHQSFLDVFISFIYDKFLFINRQKKGIKSYSEVVSYLIAYYNKNGYL